jgi:hypothetical protein
MRIENKFLFWEFMPDFINSGRIFSATGRLKTSNWEIHGWSDAHKVVNRDVGKNTICWMWSWMFFTCDRLLLSRCYDTVLIFSSSFSGAQELIDVASSIGKDGWMSSNRSCDVSSSAHRVHALYLVGWTRAAEGTSRVGALWSNVSCWLNTCSRGYFTSRHSLVKRILGCNIGLWNGGLSNQFC